MEKIKELLQELTELCNEKDVALVAQTFSREENYIGTAVVGDVKNISQASVILDFEIEEVTSMSSKELRLIGMKSILEEACDCPDCCQKEKESVGEQDGNED